MANEIGGQNTEQNWLSNLIGSGQTTKFNDISGNVFDTSKAAADSSMQFLQNNPGLGANLAGKGLFTEQKVEGTGILGGLGSDSMKGVGTLGGLAMSGLGIWNTMNAQEQAKKQWEAENARANQVMAMNTEKYNQYKADKTRLNAGYGGN